MVQIFQHDLKIPSWWKHFSPKQREKLEKEFTEQVFIHGHDGAFSVGGEWCGLNDSDTLVKVRKFLYIFFVMVEKSVYL